jgi:hypothetical protein
MATDAKRREHGQTARTGKDAREKRSNDRTVAVKAILTLTKQLLRAGKDNSTSRPRLVYGLGLISGWLQQTATVEMSNQKGVGRTSARWS